MENLKQRLLPNSKMRKYSRVDHTYYDVGDLTLEDDREHHYSSIFARQS